MKFHLNSHWPPAPSSTPPPSPFSVVNYSCISFLAIATHILLSLKDLEESECVSSQKKKEKKNVLNECFGHIGTVQIDSPPFKKAKVETVKGITKSRLLKQNNIK